MMTLSKEMDLILQEVRDQARHPIIERYIHQQEVPDSFVRVLYLMLSSQTLPQDRIRLYCVTATLLQMGLSIHETVTTSEETEREALRSRQLSVLAGDYMSSLFYKNLSEQDEIEGVACLSKAICEINEAKMELYGQQDLSSVSQSAILRLVKKVSGGLVTHLSYFFWNDPLKKNPWDPLAENLLILANWQRAALTAPEIGICFSDQFLQSLAAETFQQVREIRPLNVRHTLTDWLRGVVCQHVGEFMARKAQEG